jgi:hypothetical protein
VADLLIRIKKNKDGSASLTCIRRDGSTTWQRQEGKLGAVFPPHDLTHYAVESTLGYSQGFYGLIADGWELGDFSAPWPRGELPGEAREVEVLVGVLDLERMTLRPGSTVEFNEQVRSAASQERRIALSPRALSDEELACVRAVRAEVFARWAAVEPGAALELSFDRRVTAA